MFGRANCPCSKCGSTNTEIRNTPPGKGLVGKLLAEVSELSSLFQPKAPPLAGTRYIVCKDCGNVNLLIS